MTNEYEFAGFDATNGIVFRRLDGSMTETQEVEVYKLDGVKRLFTLSVGGAFAEAALDEISGISLGGGFDLVNIEVDGGTSAFYALDFATGGDWSTVDAGIYQFQFVTTDGAETFRNWPITSLINLYHDGNGNWYDPQHKILADLTIVDGLVDTLQTSVDTLQTSVDDITDNTYEDNAYEFVGFYNAAQLFFKRVDGSAAATPYIAIVDSQGRHYDFTNNTFTTIANLRSSTWSNYINELATESDYDDVEVSYYRCDDAFTDIANGNYRVMVFESATYDAAITSIHHLRLEDGEWKEPVDSLQTLSDVSQEWVPESLITRMISYEGEMAVGNNVLELTLGSSYGPDLGDAAVLCAVDWRKLIGPFPRRLNALSAITQISGPSGGLTVSLQGVDHALAKFKLTPITSGDYVLLVRVKEHGSNSYRAGLVDVKVVDPAATYGI